MSDFRVVRSSNCISSDRPRVGTMPIHDLQMEIGCPGRTQVSAASRTFSRITHPPAGLTGDDPDRAIKGLFFSRRHEMNENKRSLGIGRIPWLRKLTSK